MSEIAQKVQAGQRPEIKTVALPKFRTLLERAWAQRPDQRPSAEECLKTMQEILSELAIAKVRPFSSLVSPLLHSVIYYKFSILLSLCDTPFHNNGTT